MENNKINFIKYTQEHTSSTPNAHSPDASLKVNAVGLSSTYKSGQKAHEQEEYNAYIQSQHANIREQPPQDFSFLKLLINVYDSNNPNTDYTKLINHPKLKNALFIYAANETNYGYQGGLGGGTAQVGNLPNTFGILTGTSDNKGFQAINEIFFLKNRYKQYMQHYYSRIITSLMYSLRKLINEKKYAYIILPCKKVNDLSNGKSYKDYTIASAIFSPSKAVKNYLYKNLTALIPNTESNWQLMTDYLAEKTD